MVAYANKVYVSLFVTKKKNNMEKFIATGSTVKRYLCEIFSIFSEFHCVVCKGANCTVRHIGISNRSREEAVSHKWSE